MANYNRNGWLDTAIGQVRSKPENKAIRAELLGHIEDKEQYFLEKGMEPREAAGAAVEAMGDPVVVGKELDKAHPVWWARLYTVCKAVIILLGIVLIFFLIDGITKDRWEGWREHYPLWIEWTDPFMGENTTELEDQYGPVRQGGYSIDCTKVYWKPVGTILEDSELIETKNILGIDIKVSNPWPWTAPPVFMSRLQVQDNGAAALYKIYSRMPDGSRVYGTDWNSILAEQRYWDAWYFTIEVTGAEPGENVTLYLPGSNTVKWIIPVEVSR